MARFMFIESKLDEEWWKAARDRAGYIYNRAVNIYNHYYNVKVVIKAWLTWGYLLDIVMTIYFAINYLRCNFLVTW